MKTLYLHEVTYIELDQPELLITPGGMKRRKRLRPDTLMVKWDKGHSDDAWHLRHVYLMGRSTRQGSESLLLGKTLYECRRGPGVWDEDTPDWVRDLVDQSHPVPEWQRVSHAMGVS